MLRTQSRESKDTGFGWEQPRGHGLEEQKNLALVDRSCVTEVSQETVKELTHPCSNS